MTGGMDGNGGETMGKVTGGAGIGVGVGIEIGISGTGAGNGMGMTGCSTAGFGTQMVWPG